MCIRKIILVLLCVLLSTSAWSSVFLRWTYSEVPPAKTLGVNDLVIPWDSGATSLLESARKQGYAAYLEAAPEQASAAAEAGKNGAAGVLLKVAPSDQTNVDDVLRNLRSRYP